ncbi:hypothetical protein MAMT_02310 [Methylacidimicrobium tartarophylax]|uniref:Uncharacterized protein n=1 Tax=Methylacidimicrobium tartarophylax TaxID=1041768 RepID=A0A5E6MGY3_9BACT|nr:hypothetical protein MAMT_02310 [Methylacidimicrobium tartarophylax]
MVTPIVATQMPRGGCAARKPEANVDDGYPNFRAKNRKWLRENNRLFLYGYAVAQAGGFRKRERMPSRSIQISSGFGMWARRLPKSLPAA